MRAALLVLAVALLLATCGGDDKPDPDGPTGVDCVWDQSDWDGCDWQ